MIEFSAYFLQISIASVALALPPAGFFALVLFFFGSGSANSAITGFSIALLIGVMMSMFTAIFISRKLLGIVGGTFLRRFPQLFSPESLSNNNSGGQS